MKVLDDVQFGGSVVIVLHCVDLDLGWWCDANMVLVL
jgi:hypothetical protein